MGFSTEKMSASATMNDRRPSEKDALAGSRERRPSNKVAAHRKFFFFPFPFGPFTKCLTYFICPVEAQQEMAQKKTDKEECRAQRKKKALQKANQKAGIATDSEDDFQPRDNPSVSKTIKRFLNINFVL